MHVLVDFLDFVDVLFQSGIFEYVLFYGGLSSFYVGGKFYGGLLRMSVERICVRR